MVSPSLCSLRATLKPLSVAILNLVPGVEAPGQVDGPFTQAEGMCALVHCLCSALGMVACFTVFLIVTVFWAQKHKLF